MPSGNSVRPEKWSNVLDLFDNGTYSVVWGHYFENPTQRCVGVRWNGKDESAGYPNLAGRPLWYVEPAFLSKPILLELSYQVSKNNSLGNLANIQKALSEVAA